MDSNLSTTADETPNPVPLTKPSSKTIVQVEMPNPAEQTSPTSSTVPPKAPGMEEFGKRVREQVLSNLRAASERAKLAKAAQQQHQQQQASK